ncbi:MAG TPA: hypothetical protein VGR14_20275 [Verrucomicrobiae bacterium]|jgi:hypothetical protein|nr:hypothetical protein [Verrucomicrobiae bacterium]
MKMNRIQSHNVTSLVAVFRGVRECRAKLPGDPQRIIVLLAPADFSLPPFYGDLLRQRGAVLVQGDSLDKSRVGFLKVLAHRTRCVPLLLTNAGVWRRWNRRRTLEAAQIRRRTHLVVEFQAPASNNLDLT